MLAFHSEKVLTPKDSGNYVVSLLRSGQICIVDYDHSTRTLLTASEARRIARALFLAADELETQGE